MDPISLTAGAAGGIKLFQEVTQGLQKVGRTANNITRFAKNSSLIDITRVARVEPILVVDADVMNVSYLSDVCNAMHTLFSGYYLQAVNLLGTISGVSLAQKLAPLNPNRTLGFEEHRDWRYSVESYKFRLPTTHNKLAMEAEIARSAEVDKESLGSLKDASNLSTGKLYNVKITDGTTTAVVPVSIRLMAAIMPTRSVVSMFTFKDSTDMDMKERWHAFKAGRLEFWRDLVMCKDLVDKHRTAAIHDKDGVYSQILGREASNKRAGLFTGNPSLATASNLAIISTDTVAQMEVKLMGKLSNFKVRQTLFDNTNLMILAVVDKGWDRVTFYHRGLDEVTSVSERDLKGAKGGGNEVTEIMKAFLAGSAPQVQ